MSAISQSSFISQSLISNSLSHRAQNMNLMTQPLTRQDNREVPTTGDLLNFSAPRQRAGLKGYDLGSVTEP